MAAGGSEFLSGLDLLLEAAAYHDRINTVTPPCGKKRDVASSSHLAQPSPLEPDRCSGPAPIAKPPKKRTKMAFSEVGNKLWLTSNPRARSAAIKFSPIKRSSKKPSRCSTGSAHHIWEGTGEDDAAATSARPFADAGAKSHQDDAAAKEDTHSFTLYDERENEYINAVHNVVRRDIWEGFVDDIATDDVLDEGAQVGEIASTSDARLAERLARWHRRLPLRAERSPVYPRSLERIYLANIRFQRDHIGHCTFIPDNVKENCFRLKNSKGVSRGEK